MKVEKEIKDINDLARRLNNKIDALNRYYADKLANDTTLERKKTNK